MRILVLFISLSIMIIPLILLIRELRDTESNKERILMLFGFFFEPLETWAMLFYVGFLGFLYSVIFLWFFWWIYFFIQLTQCISWRLWAAKKQLFLCVSWRRIEVLKRKFPPFIENINLILIKWGCFKWQNYC